ncbi:MAG: type III pantothenate kinase [Actinomycetota bacterium]
MLLAIDTGNTQTHIGIFRRDEIVAQWRTSTEASRTSDELALTFQQFLALEGLSFSREVTGVVISSVVPSLTASLREMVARYFHFDPVMVEPGVRTGMPVLTDHPREVGADRIANAVAAQILVGGPAIIIDFGTATTFDAVSDRGEYLGGAIVPGIEVSADALFGAAAQIQKVELRLPATVVGRSTADAVCSGLLNGAASMMEGMVERMRKELGGRAAVVATGGLAPLVLALCSTPVRHEPTLTLLGLRLIYDRNVTSD